LWHMNQMVGRAVGHFELDGRELNFLMSLNPPGYIITDCHGLRFADEEARALLRHDFYFHLLAVNAATGANPRNPCVWFFDERRRSASPLTLTHIGAPAVGLYDWSTDNSREIAKGWIRQAGSIEELAGVAGIDDPDAAVEMIARYNAACEAGHDPLGRRPETAGADRRGDRNARWGMTRSVRCWS